jgi:pimeloyl-ACP methyl ester carboxylesterase
MAWLAMACQAAEPAAKPSTPEPPPPPQVLSLPTSDGIDIAAWFYGVAGDVESLATVVVLHDLGGSHETVEPLAKALQQSGCNVVAPDLRGHGKSQIAQLVRSAGEAGQPALLRSSDFAAMTATGGGRFRDQSAIRGDLEVVRNWIKQQSDGGTLSLDNLYLIGSGLGAAVAAAWTVQDAAWPAIATGQQGGHVRGLVMIDPAFVTKGFSIGKSLSVEPLKRARPAGWYDNRLTNAETRRNTSPATDSEASLLFVKFGGRLTGDKLAAARSVDPRRPDPARLIVAFIKQTDERR